MAESACRLLSCGAPLVQMMEECKYLRLQTSEHTILRVAVTDAQRIRDLKEHVVGDVETGQTRKKIRFIAKGKILDEAKTVGFYKLESDSYIFCNIVDMPVEDVDGGTGTSSGADVRGGARERAEGGAPARGFERLAEMGHTPEEVAVIRAQFLASRNINPSNLPDRETLREMEEAWMSGDVRQEDLAENLPAVVREREEMRIQLIRAREGTHKDMFYGILLGFLFNIMMLLWIGERSMSRRQKIGILTGLCVNLAFGVLHSLLTLTDD